MRMRSVVVLACSFAAAGVQAAPPAHDHEHAAHAAPVSATMPALRWATDAPLREGMGRVREALDDLRHYEMGHMTADMARERAVAVEDAVKFVFANCKLAPEPDGALHRMLVPLLAAAQRLDKQPTDLSAVAAMRDAVASYSDQFDDPQWPRGTAAEVGGGHQPHAH